MQVWEIAVLVLAAFLVGSIPFGLFIGKAHGIDIRQHGSGNIGATNVGRVLGAKAWLMCFVLDFLKGCVPTMAAGWYGGWLHWDLPDAAGAWMWLAVMAAGPIGHMYSPWLKFKGGKGVATGFGSVVGVLPLLTCAGGLAFAVFVVMLAWKRYVSLAAIAAAGALPLLVFGLSLAAGGPLGLTTLPMSAGAVLSRAWPFLVVTGVLAGLVIWRHRSNLARLRAGTEPRVGGKKPARDA